MVHHGPLIANVVIIPLLPWFGTLLGRKNHFALSIAGFTVTSVLCGLANDTSTEIVLRFLRNGWFENLRSALSASAASCLYLNERS